MRAVNCLLGQQSFILKIASARLFTTPESPSGFIPNDYLSRGMTAFLVTCSRLLNLAKKTKLMENNLA